MTDVMSDLPQKLYTAADVRKLDRIAIEERNIAGLELMERAGQAGFDLLQGLWPRARNIAVVCGIGNNGGDGYILARLAHEAGLNVDIIQIGDGANIRGDALSAAEQCQALNLIAKPFDPGLIISVDLVVDALLGTGLDRELDGDWQSLIRNINQSATTILSLDIPSGLDADTGICKPVAIEADATLTFIGVKQGLLTGQGPSHCGKLNFASLNVPDDVYEQVKPGATRVNLAVLKANLPRRPRDTHKGQCGHVLIIGGDYGYAGAVRMAGEAAMRVGAGLVTIATRSEHALNIPLARPELMTAAINSAKDLNRLLDKVKVVVIGPGLGQSGWASDLLSKTLQSNLPLLVDADGLNLLASEPARSSNWILTPHVGEAARLLACSVAEIQADRFAAVSRLQKEYGGICVLKGSGTLIADGSLPTSVCDAGNPGMASAGMGDVLSGVIAGLLAQDLELADAARVGVCLHSAAADNASIKGERGLLASDLMPELRSLANPE